MARPTPPSPHCLAARRFHLRLREHVGKPLPPHTLQYLRYLPLSLLCFPLSFPGIAAPPPPIVSAPALSLSRSAMSSLFGSHKTDL
eukprot:scaffold101_cov26-Tisochrysis_lutea.AAC.1